LVTGAVIGSASRLDFLPTVKITAKSADIFVVNFFDFCFAN